MCLCLQVQVGDSLKFLGIDESGKPQFQVVPAAAIKHQNTSTLVFGLGFLFCPIWFMSFCLLGKKHLDSATSRCFNKVSLGCAICNTVLFIVWITVLFTVLLPLWLGYVDTWWEYSHEYDGIMPNNTCCALGHFSATLDADCTVEMCMPCPGHDTDCKELLEVRVRPPIHTVVVCVRDVHCSTTVLLDVDCFGYVVFQNEADEEALDACYKTCELDCKTHDDCTDGFCVLGIEDSDEGFCTVCRH